MRRRKINESYLSYPRRKRNHGAKQTMLLNQSRKMLKAAALTTLLLLIMLLSSCASKSPLGACPTLPSAYIAHLDKTGFDGNTYGDITQYSVILKRERDVCLSRVDKIREWQVEHAKK